MQRLYPSQNGQFGAKIKNSKNMRKPILQEYYGCAVKKTAGKNTKYSRNETILKIDHLAKALVHGKAIAICKMFSLGQKLKIPKTCEKRFYKSVRVVLRKKPLGKTPNMREMRPF